MKTGYIVKFNTRKGMVQGAVIGSRWSTRGQKAARDLNSSLRLRGMAAAQVAEGQMVYEVADIKGEAIWTTNHGTVVRKASKKQMVAGIELKAKIQTGNAERKREQTSENLKKQDERGIERLTKGDAIEIKYRGGYWRREKFHHYANSGKIAFYSSYSKRGYRFCWPDNVRIAK